MVKKMSNTEIGAITHPDESLINLETAGVARTIGVGSIEKKDISRCANCKFYKDPSCCFNPPEWREYSKRYEFVKTTSHQWCGKWEIRDVR